MKKYLRNMDKQKGEHNKKSEKDKLNRHGILKDSRCAPECTGDTIQGNQEYATSRYFIATIEVSFLNLFYSVVYHAVFTTIKKYRIYSLSRIPWP